MVKKHIQMENHFILFEELIKITYLINKHCEKWLKLGLFWLNLRIIQLKYTPVILWMFSLFFFKINYKYNNKNLLNNEKKMTIKFNN